MTVLHLDCSLGVSGDMLLAALLDAHPDPSKALDLLRTELGKLRLAGLTIDLLPKQVAAIATKTMDIRQSDSQPLRHLSDITALLAPDASDTVGTRRARELALDTFRALAQAEATVHGTTLDSVHFHEVGAVDTLVDILGAHLLIESLGVRRVTASAVNLGAGFVTMAHGAHPVPPPAVAELAKGLRTFGADPDQYPMEMATPTGMAILKSVVRAFGPLPLGSILRVGYGSGQRSSDRTPTYLRAFVIEEEDPEALYHCGCAEQ